MLRKLLEKVFINKKFTQCKTSGTLKIDVVEIPDNKNIGLVFLNQANSCSYPSQILIRQFPAPGTSLPLSPSLSTFTLANLNRSSTQYFPVLHRFPCFVPPHSTMRYHKDWICQTVCQAKPIKCVIKLYTDHNILWVKPLFQS